MPNTRPELMFNEEGVCDACISVAKKHLEEIIEQYPAMYTQGQDNIPNLKLLS